MSEVAMAQIVAGREMCSVIHRISQMLTRVNAHLDRGTGEQLPQGDQYLGAPQSLRSTFNHRWRSEENLLLLVLDGSKYAQPTNAFQRRWTFGWKMNAGDVQSLLVESKFYYQISSGNDRHQQLQARPLDD